MQNFSTDHRIVMLAYLLPPLLGTRSNSRFNAPTNLRRKENEFKILLWGAIIWKPLLPFSLQTNDKTVNDNLVLDIFNTVNTFAI